MIGNWVTTGRQKSGGPPSTFAAEGPSASEEDLAQWMLDRDGSVLDAAATARARRNERRGPRRPADAARES
jgi:hypothetical protein